MNFFVILIDRDIEGAAQIEGHPEDVTKVIKRYKFRKAISLAEQFPELPGYHFSKEYPDNRMLTDFQDNTSGLLILSKTFAEIIKSLEQKNVELLPIKIIDHRGKVASDSYSIANLVGTVDCIDLEKSVYETSAMDFDEIFSIEKLVLNKERIPEGTHIFRLHRKPTQFMVSEKLKSLVEKEGITGMKFVPAEEFDDS